MRKYVNKNKAFKYSFFFRPKFGTKLAENHDQKNEDFLQKNDKKLPDGF